MLMKNSITIRNSELVKMWKDIIMAYFIVLSRYLCVGIEGEVMKNLSQDSSLPTNI